MMLSIFHNQFLGHLELEIKEYHLRFVTKTLIISIRDVGPY